MKLRDLKVAGLGDPAIFKDKIRILTMSDHPMNNSGYGIVHRHIINGLTGWNPKFHIASIGWHTPKLPSTNLDVSSDIAVIGCNNKADTYGIETLRNVLPIYQPNILITLGDPWMVEMIPQLKSAGFQWIHYLPVDGIDMPKRWISLLEHIDKVVVFSKFGFNVVQSSCPSILHKVDIVEHGVDTNLFRRRSIEDARKHLGINQDDFVVLWMGRNIQRKRIDIALESFSRFISASVTCSECGAIYFDKHNEYNAVSSGQPCFQCGSLKFNTTPAKNNAKLFLFTTSVDVGYDIPDLVNKFGLTGKVMVVKNNTALTGYSFEDVAHSFNASNVFLNTSTSEGWGLPIHEAMASGIPVVVPNFSGYMGSLIEHMETGFAYAYKFLDRDNTGYIRCIPSPADAVKYLDLVYYITNKDEDGFRNRWPAITVKSESELSRLIDDVISRGEYRAKQLSWDVFEAKFAEVVQCCIPEYQLECVLKEVNDKLDTTKETILFVGERFDQTSGAERSIYHVLDALKSRYNVIAYFIKPNRAQVFREFAIAEMNGITKIMAVPGESFIRDAIKYIKPSLVITQHRITSCAAKVCNEFKIPYHVFMRSYEGLCEDGLLVSTCKHNCESCCVFLDEEATRLREEYWKSLSGAARVIFNSDYFKDLFMYCWNGAGIKDDVTSIMLPFVETDNADYIVSPLAMRSSDYITLIKPTQAKGSLIFLEIARKLSTAYNGVLSHFKYLLVGEADKITLDTIQKFAINNIEIVSDADMAEVYARSAIVLVPSICKETFGRVPIEAMANGVPVLSAGLGGLWESNTSSCIIEEWWLINKWVSEIKHILMNDYGLRDNVLKAQSEFLESYKQRRDIHLQNYMNLVADHVKLSRSS